MSLVYMLDTNITSAAIRGAPAIGLPIDHYDAMIAAHACAHGLIIVTDNERHFRRVPGLTVENWLRA
jgi:predicted nucleic acid-binding protein